MDLRPRFESEALNTRLWHSLQR